MKKTNKCLKCSLKGCSKCTGDSKHNLCLSCKEPFSPILDKEKKIKSCMKTCQKGENEKCFTCDKTKCGSCNVGYKLIKGECVLNHSLKAIFITNHKKENIMLINKTYANNIVELFIDGQNVTPSYNHTFLKKGEHNILMSLKHTGLTSGKMMFSNLTHLISINFTSDFGKINMKNMSGMFNNCFNLKSIELSYLKTDDVKDFSFMFYKCTSLESLNLSNFNMQKVLNISYMFSNCKSLKEISLKSFATNNVKDMTGLFYGCSSLPIIDLSKFNTQNSVNMSYMFGGCSELKSINISSFDTKKVKDLSYMFNNCSSLKAIDLSKMNTQNVSYMDGMFMGCSSLQSADLSKFITKNIKTANKMFYGCISLKNLDISSFANIPWNKKNKLFDEKISKDGTIKINKKFLHKTENNIPKHWKKIVVK
jgi:surface protein